VVRIRGELAVLLALLLVKRCRFTGCAHCAELRLSKQEARSIVEGAWASSLTEFATSLRSLGLLTVPRGDWLLLKGVFRAASELLEGVDNATKTAGQGGRVDLPA
jgi:hypothetical protein